MGENIFRLDTQTGLLKHWVLLLIDIFYIGFTIHQIREIYLKILIKPTETNSFMHFGY